MVSKKTNSIKWELWIIIYMDFHYITEFLLYYTIQNNLIILNMFISFHCNLKRCKQVYYNDNPITVNDKADELLRELNGLKDSMVENLDRLIERDGKIEVIL